MKLEKTYKFLNHESPLPVSEIKQLYNGHWVFLTNVKFSTTGVRELLSGTPTIIGAKAYDGAKDGIYEKYKDDKYGHSADINLLPNKYFISALKMSGTANA